MLRPDCRLSQHARLILGKQDQVVRLVGEDLDHRCLSLLTVIIRAAWGCGSDGRARSAVGPRANPAGDTRPRHASRYAPGAWYLTCSALRSASIVSSTVRRTAVSNELSAPPALIASATAAIDTLSGASHRL